MTSRLAGVWGLAWRESRTARRSLFLYMSAISLGAAALVAIDSYSANVTRSVREQSRSLMGGDVSVNSSKPFPAAIDSLFDSLARNGTGIARVTSFPSMALIPRTSATHLVQVAGVTSGYPFYTDLTTQPVGRWAALQSGAYAVVDPSLLTLLNARVGDTLKLGFGKFTIIATLAGGPTSRFAELFGPRVFIPAKYVAETQLLVFGSTADRTLLMKLRPGVDPDKFVRPFKKRLEDAQARVRTVTQAEELTADVIDNLTNFIGIVGLVALLLGGIGVASGVRAFVARKIDTVAILRCLGASSGQVLWIYTAQAAVMGIVGALMGAAIGVGLQFLIPLAVSGLLPVDVHVSLVPAAILAGLLMGGWTALIFALRPLLALRNISPLQTLRRDTDAEVLRMRWSDGPRLIVNIALVASVLAIALLRAHTWRQAVWISAGTGFVILALIASATLLSFLAKHALRRGWPYVIRQGVANLYRPGNQTRSVVLALGFGAFLVTTLYLVHDNLLRRFDSIAATARGNVVFFDIQEDQEHGLDSLVRSSRSEIVEEDPVVTMRIAAINARPVAELIAASRADFERTAAPNSGGRRSMWGLRREFRSTFRDSLMGGEQLLKGKWFPRRATLGPGDTAEISAEEGIAQDLKLKIGDVITWDVQGVQIPTRVSSIRKVNWSRFEPNFFMVFEPAALQAAPKQFILLAHVDGPKTVAALQRSSVGLFPNVSIIDLSSIRATINRIVSKVALAIRFIALFSVGIAIPVLFAAVSATRRDRIRESVLLKTLGASRGQVARILLVEYALLGALGSAVGMVLAIGGGWAIVHQVFKMPFAPAPGGTLLIGTVTLLLTVTTGLIAGRDSYKETPVTALRDA